MTEYHLEFLSLKGGCTGSSESIHDKMSHCWKSKRLILLSPVQSLLSGAGFYACEVGKTWRMVIRKNITLVA